MNWDHNITNERKGYRILAQQNLEQEHNAAEVLISRCPTCNWDLKTCSEVVV